jgi:hypothetical protein
LILKLHLTLSQVGLRPLTWQHFLAAMNTTAGYKSKSKSKAIPVTGREGP